MCFQPSLGGQLGVPGDVLERFASDLVLGDLQPFELVLENSRINVTVFGYFKFHRESESHLAVDGEDALCSRSFLREASTAHAPLKNGSKRASNKSTTCRNFLSRLLF